MAEVVRLPPRKQALVYCMPDEVALLNDFRRTNKTGQKSTMIHAKLMREVFPAELADLDPRHG